MIWYKEPPVEFPETRSDSEYGATFVPIRRIK